MRLRRTHRPVARNSAFHAEEATLPPVALASLIMLWSFLAKQVAREHGKPSMGSPHDHPLRNSVVEPFKLGQGEPLGIDGVVPGHHLGGGVLASNLAVTRRNRVVEPDAAIVISHDDVADDERVWTKPETVAGHKA